MVLRSPASGWVSNTLVLTRRRYRRAGALTIVARAELAAEAANPVVVDTPDLDGDQPAHHAQADRAFRWAQRIVFVVTPEKYQMTELLPYYRLARRYEVP